MGVIVRLSNPGRQVDDIEVLTHSNDTIRSIRRQVLRRIKPASGGTVKVDLFVNGDILDQAEDCKLLSQHPIRDKTVTIFFISFNFFWIACLLMCVKGLKYLYIVKGTCLFVIIGSDGIPIHHLVPVVLFQFGSGHLSLTSSLCMGLILRNLLINFSCRNVNVLVFEYLITCYYNSFSFSN